MRKPGWATVILQLVVTAFLCSPASAVDLSKLSAIYLPDKPDWRENSAAQAIRDQIKEHYLVDLPIVEGPGRGGADGTVILIGRELAIASGRVEKAELEALKYEGYLIEASGRYLIAAGYRPTGTQYAAGALLERLGIRFYSAGRHTASKVVFTKPDSPHLEDFTYSSKPFFEFRGLTRTQDPWALGLTSSDMGDPRRGAANPEIFSREATRKRGDGNWMVSGHTAAYLMPLELYYDEHPEYFAMQRDGKRERNKLWHRTRLCMSNPAVHRIAGQRMLEWMGLQDDKRFFYATDGDDTGCSCPQCRATDLYPHYTTDRYLSWVNSVARTVKDEHPENWVFALAYLQTVKPPAQVELEPNVGIIYAPWFWTSAGTRAFDWANPRNVTAMEEFMDWTMKFPGHIGVYNYPGGSYLWLSGQESLIKFQARHGAKFNYYDGGPAMFSGLWAYVMGRLNWDPLLDSAVLEEQYIRAYYGAAAEPMLAYLKIHKAAEKRTYGFLFKDAELVTRGKELLLKAQELAQGDADLKKRVDADVDYWMKQYNEASSQVETALAKADEAQQDLAADRRSEDATASGPGEAKRAEASGGKSVVVAVFNDRNDADGWEAVSSMEAVASRSALQEVRTLRSVTGERIAGLSIDLPFNELPIKRVSINPKGRDRLHSGWFRLGKWLAEPIDIAGCDYVEFRIHASEAMPATVMLGMGGGRGLASDVHLAAGEQIVRMDLRVHGWSGHWKRYKDDWDGTITSVAVKFYPKDNLYPYPEVSHARATLINVTAHDHVRTLAELPYENKTIYLTHYRANVPHSIPDEVEAKGKWWGFTEGFRSSTEHGTLTPIVAIVTGRGASEPLTAAATQMQSYLEKLYGVRLPINPEGLSDVDAGTGNVILLGREAGLASGAVTEQELEYVGEEGFALRVTDGRIVIAGASPAATAYGVARYLEDLGVRFLEPGIREVVPNRAGEFLYELYLLDSPYFANRGQGGWKLYAPGSVAAAPAAEAGDGEAEADVESVIEVANRIKDCVRREERITPDILAAGATSPLHRYVVAKLLWDPFLDTTRIIADFRGESR